MTARRSLPGGLAVGALAWLAACAPRAAASGNASAGDVGGASREAAPHLARLAPDTVALGRGAVPTLVLTGTGFIPGPPGPFDTGANTLRVGRATFERLSADSTGTTIRFALPLTYTDTAAHGRPSSFSPGTYPVAVVNARGTSNSLTLTMIP